MRYTLRQLQVFAAVGRYGTVSEAAARLSMSQSAASTSLAELERQFDRSLFDRHGKRLRLNAEGEQLLPKALDLLDRAEEIETLLTGGMRYGTVRVGATLTIGNYLGALLAGEFMRRHPGSRVTLEVANTTRIAARVAAFELDLGLIEGEWHGPDLEMTDWVPDELAVFGPPGHPLADAADVPLDRALEEWWILREPGSGTRQTFDRAIGERRTRLNVRMELEHTEGIKRAVESGLGIGCVSRLALKEAFRRGSLAEIRLAGLDLRRNFHFLLHREKYRSAGIDAFIGLCREVSASVARSDDIAI
jgi:DNA-binding transcriptional LysR family regulator